MNVKICSEHKSAVLLAGRSRANIFGLGGDERLARFLRKEHLPILTSEILIDAYENIIIVNAGYVFEDRVLSDFAQTRGSVLISEDNSGQYVVVAATCSPKDVYTWKQHVNAQTPYFELSNRQEAYFTSCELSGFLNAESGKYECPLVLEVAPETALDVEYELFTSAQKNTVDFITKYIFSQFSFGLIKWLSDRLISSRLISMITFGLAMMAFFMFWNGSLVLGAVLAWSICFLEYAKVQIAGLKMQSTKWGGLYNRATGFLYPVGWYAAWTQGIIDNDFGGRLFGDNIVLALLIVTVVSVFVSRVVERYFSYRHNMEIHIWKQFDCFFCYVAASRNINLLLLTVAAFAGAPEAGLATIAAWSLMALFVHLIRSYQAENSAMRSPVRSWLADY